MKLNSEQITALEYACSPAGGWPREKATARSWVIRSYRALERRGLVEEVKDDAKEVGREGAVRLHFIATAAGRSALSKDRMP